MSEIGQIVIHGQQTAYLEASQAFRKILSKLHVQIPLLYDVLPEFLPCQALSESFLLPKFALLKHACALKCVFCDLLPKGSRRVYRSEKAFVVRQFS